METTKIPEIPEAAPEDQSFGLFNEGVQEKIAANEAYYTVLVEQWKTANELTASISEQRNNINNFYMSLLSLLIGGVLLSDQIAAGALVSRTVFLIIILILGVGCCLTWIKQIEKCKRINFQKFMIIDRMEKQLPANVLSCEGKVDTAEDSAKGSAGKAKGLSDYERTLAWVFCVAIILIVTVMLAEMWWEPVCTLIQ